MVQRICELYNVWHGTKNFDPGSAHIRHMIMMSRVHCHFQPNKTPPLSGGVTAVSTRSKKPFCLCWRAVWLIRAGVEYTKNAKRARWTKWVVYSSMIISVLFYSIDIDNCYYGTCFSELIHAIIVLAEFVVFC